jgi:hypothetical protein
MCLLVFNNVVACVLHIHREHSLRKKKSGCVQIILLFLFNDFHLGLQTIPAHIGLWIYQECWRYRGSENDNEI